MSIWSYMRGPKMLDIKVGYRCNNRCVHCVVEPVRHKLQEESKALDQTTEKVLAQIERASRVGAETIVLTGGEVTLRDDFHRFLTYAVEKGLKVCIQTNGRLLADKAVCELVADLPGILFVVALHASKPEVHDEITREEGSFTETIQAIRNLRELNKETAAKIVLSKLNRTELLNTALLAMELAVDEFCVVFPHALDFPDQHFIEIIPRYLELSEEIASASQLSEREKFPITFETFPYCVLPSTPTFWKRSCDLHSRLNHDGQTSASLLEREELFDWEQVRPRMKRKEASCQECVFDPLCEGPWTEYAEHYSFDEFIPVSQEQVADFISED